MNLRTCVGCRGTDAQDQLLRFVVVDARLVVDERAVLPGRGAWLHNRPECVAAAQSRKAFARSLRTQVDDAILSQL